LFSSVGMRCPAQGDTDRPGAKEQADVDSANKALDRVYQGLLSKAEGEEQSSLREAQRAWIKWRDAEAMYIARHGGAVGGSALRIDYAVAELKLIEERINVLKDYTSQAPAD
ncbi:MAG: lysozyme inhibitor LprI family protein, partial [Acidobacteriota bacterium]|nr:lysozyme inhibitor LprI family protein [Acidobacteriota bacterium]